MTDNFYMAEALKEANKALKYDDVPVGAVLVKEGNIISRGYNQVEHLQDSTAHAEILCIKKGIKNIGYKHLLDCTLYVTLEPCVMCVGAIVLSRISELIFGAYDSKAGACGSLYNIPQDKRLNHRLMVTGGVMEEESSKLLMNFFSKLRINK